MGSDVVVKRSVIELDNFDSYVDTYTDGGDDVAVGSLIQGTRIKFVDPHWYNTETGAIITGSRLTLVDVVKVATKWGPNQRPLETRPIAPSEPWPNFEKWNENCPQSEWRLKFGKSVGPWEGQHGLYFFDKDYNRFTWASSLDTLGSAVCAREITDQIRRVRRFRGHVYPVVELGRKDWPTGPAGLKQRPYLLNNIEWVAVNGEALPAPAVEPAKIAAPVEAKPAEGVTPMATSGAPVEAKPVEPITLKEELDDDLPF